MEKSESVPQRAPLDPPHYGYRRGMRTPEPGEIKLQGWVAVAEGATGVFYYAAAPGFPGRRHLWDAGWTETANTRAAGELFGKLRRVGPLLCRLERDYQESGFVEISNPRVLAHRFVARPGHSQPGRYLVIASLDGFGPQSFDLKLRAPERVFDVVSRQEITGKTKGLRLGPGEGTVLLLGSQDDFQSACRQMDQASD